MKSNILILLLIILNSCSGHTKSIAQKEAEVIISDSLNLKKPTDKSEGIIYFSFDNGMNWENRSNGLPEKISIGLGGIAGSDTLLGLVTKENGVYLFNFQKNSWEHVATDSQIIRSNPSAFTFYKNSMYTGTQTGGVFTSDNQGKTWASNNRGLGNITIRRFAEINGKLYAGTNAGLYVYNNILNTWEPEFVQNFLQVNGITAFEGNIYIGTNQGIFKSDLKVKNWLPVLPGHSLHNISSDNTTIYSMT